MLCTCDKDFLVFLVMNFSAKLNKNKYVVLLSLYYQQKET